MSHDKLIRDSFITDPNIKWRIDESAEVSVVDGINILGRAVGPFFVPDGHSLNKRFYSKSLWERAINENSDRLGHGEMLGTIGHDQPLDDQALLEGKVSHKVTKLWIDEESGAGMGEVQILATSAGKELNALLRGGVRLKVSSRAMGEYKGKTKDGSQIIDEDSFRLEGFDFVQKPGVPTAIPVLVESDQTIDNAINDSSTETTMSHELLESIAKEKMKLEGQLSEALGKVSTLESDKGALRSALEGKEKEVTRLEGSLVEHNGKVSELETKLAETLKIVESFSDLGTPEEISAALEAAETTIKAYSEFGTPSELTNAFERVDQLVEDYSQMGSPDELEATLELTEAYTELGTVDELKDKFTLLSKFENLGSISELDKILAVAESYAELGSPQDISKTFDMTESIVKKFQDEARVKEVAEISTKFGVKAALVESMLMKHGREETVGILEAIKSSDVSDRYTTNETVVEVPVKEVPTEVIEETEKAKAAVALSTSRMSRLMESFSR